MIVIQAKSENELTLGRQGENLARQVAFDLSAWEAEYGPGVAELIHQRPGDAAPYPVAAVREGGTLVWTLTATDTAVASSYGSDGRCELRYYVGEVLVKSRTWLTKVIRAMPTPSETAPPEPEQGWVDQVVAVGAAAKASADAAKADADRAAALAAEVSKKAAQAAQDASDAAKAMEAAQTAQRLADEAQSAAEAARNAAETAQAAAEQSANDAVGAKQGAEAALKAAQDAAAAADQALADLQALYQEMQTWAQGVIQDVNAAGSIAVQSVQSAGDAQVQRVTDEGATQTANAKAQANAAAQSAAGAAQSAQQAAESAAVYDNVVADVTQLKQDVAAITPDDTTVDGKPWTSKKIVDTICQPFEESGNPVQCYPVENYPLGVKVSWEPVQEGSGDPSPDNIRPITGRDSVTITHSNDVVSSDYDIALPETVYGGTLDVESGEGQKTWRLITFDGTENWQNNGIVESRKEQQWALYKFLQNYPGNFGISSHFGNTNVSHEYPFNFVRIAANSIVLHVAADGPFATVGDLKAYLAAQYAAGTPVQVCYKLAEPVPYTATGAQPIPALSGVNTIYTDADSVVVKGAEDPKHTITELKNAIISLGGNV